MNAEKTDFDKILESILDTFRKGIPEENSSNSTISSIENSETSLNISSNEFLRMT